MPIPDAAPRSRNAPPAPRHVRRHRCGRPRRGVPVPRRWTLARAPGDPGRFRRKAGTASHGNDCHRTRCRLRFSCFPVLFLASYLTRRAMHTLATGRDQLMRGRPTKNKTPGPARGRFDISAGSAQGREHGLCLLLLRRVTLLEYLVEQFPGAVLVTHLLVGFWPDRAWSPPPASVHRAPRLPRPARRDPG